MVGTYSSQEERKYKKENDTICFVQEENIMKKKKGKKESETSKHDLQYSSFCSHSYYREGNFRF